MKFAEERPLDNLVTDGGFCAIFRTMGIVGDSLASGEFQSTKEDGSQGYHDYYEYSWGQYMARACGNTAYNFSRGGMTAKAFNATFGRQCGFYDKEKVCQCYIVALGVNDLFGQKQPVGEAGDCEKEDYDSEKNFSFAGEYEKILKSIKEMQPKARVFLMTMPKGEDAARNELAKQHAALLYKLAEKYEFTYVIDLYKYAPVYDAEFRNNFYLAGHMNPMGYIMTARFTLTYIDYIIRHNMEDFKQVGFIGTGFYSKEAKW